MFPKPSARTPVIIFLICAAAFLFPQEVDDDFYDDKYYEDEFYDDDIDENEFDDEDYFAAEEDEGLTITGAPETTQQKKTVEREQIRDAHAADLAQLLAETAGLGFTRYGPYGNQTDINMRGFDSSRIAVLVNGIPVNSAIDGSFDINSIDLNSIERIEIIEGGSDTKFNVSGNLGGVINIITVGQPAPGFALSASVSNTANLPGYYINRSGKQAGPAWEDIADAQRVDFSLGYGTETWAVKGGGFANRAANHFIFQEKTTGRTRRLDGNEVWDGGGNISFVNYFKDFSKLIASGNFYYGDKNQPAPSFFSPVSAKDKTVSTGESVLYEMPRAFHDDFSMEASAAHNWSRSDYALSASSSLHNQNKLNLINRWTWYAHDDWTVRFGGDFTFNLIDSTDIGRHNRSDGGIYGTAEWKPAEKLLLIASVKGVFAPHTAVPVPKLGLLWTPLEMLSIKANGFRSFKLPSFQDLYWNSANFSGNPNLEPEDGWGADLSAAYQFGKRANLEGIFFFQWTEDSIHWSNQSGAWQPENIAHAAFFGAELRGGVNLPGFLFIDAVKISASYKYMRSWLLSYGYGWGDGKRIPYMPDHAVGASAAFNWNGGKKSAGSLMFAFRWESLRYANTSNQTELETPFLLDLTLNQKTGEMFTVFVAARNLLNKPYESYSEYFVPGMTVTAGVRMEIK